MSLQTLPKLILILMLLFGQIFTPAMAKQWMDVSVLSSDEAAVVHQDQRDQHSQLTLHPNHAHNTHHTHHTHHAQHPNHSAHNTETAPMSCHEPGITTSSVSDCCGDNCHCPSHSCGSGELNRFAVYCVAVSPSWAFGFDGVAPLQRYLPPLFKPPIKTA